MACSQLVLASRGPRGRTSLSSSEGTGSSPAAPWLADPQLRSVSYTHSSLVSHAPFPPARPASVRQFLAMVSRYMTFFLYSHSRHCFPSYSPLIMYSTACLISDHSLAVPLRLRSEVLGRERALGHMVLGRRDWLHSEHEVSVPLRLIVDLGFTCFVAHTVHFSPVLPHLPAVAETVLLRASGTRN